MKKSLIALAALALVGAASAQTTDGKPGFQITGNLNAGYVSQNYGGNKVSGFEQNLLGTSNLYMRGLEDLGGGLKAHFMHGSDIQFMTTFGDQGVLPTFAGSGAPTAATLTNAGAQGTFGNDQKMVGISGGFGTVNFGTINNQSLYGGVVLFNPTVGTSYGGGYGSVICASLACAGNYGVRADNTMEYKSPVMSGFQVFYQNATKQKNNNQSTTVANFTTALGLQNQAGWTEVSAKYSNGPIVAQVTRLDTDATGVAAIAAASQVKSHLDTMVAAYDLGNGLRIGAIRQAYLKNSTTAASVSDRTTTGFNAIYTMGANTFMLTSAQAKENNTLRATYGGKTSKFTGAQYRYDLSKMTSLQARWEKVDDLAGTFTANTQATWADRVRTRSTLGLNVNF